MNDDHKMFFVFRNLKKYLDKSITQINALLVFPDSEDVVVVVDYAVVAAAEDAVVVDCVVVAAAEDVVVVDFVVVVGCVVDCYAAEPWGLSALQNVVREWALDEPVVSGWIHAKMSASCYMVAANDSPERYRVYSWLRWQAGHDSQTRIVPGSYWPDANDCFVLA
jgi:hypothetical protein